MATATNTQSRRLAMRPWLILALIVVAGFTFRLADVNRQGETWDEVAYYDAGRQFMHNLRYLDFTAEHWNANKEHPPFAKLVYGFVSRDAYRANIVNYTPGREASAVMGMLTVIVVFLIGRRLANDRVGLIAAATLTFLPLFVALNIVLGLDTPTTLTFALTIWLFLKAVYARSHWLYLASALMAGVAIGTRLSNLFILPVLLVIWLITLQSNAKMAPHSTAPALRTKPFHWSELLHVATFALIPLATVWASWPWLWGAGWRAHLDATLGHWTIITVAYLGNIQSVPPSYYFVYMLAVIPGFVLVALAWFLYRAVRTGRIHWLVVVAWLVIPFGFSFFKTRQAGFRYFLQITPAIALAVGLVFDELMIRMKQLDRRVFIAAYVAYLIVPLLLIRPYYLDYYNEFVGGPKVVAAHRWFQIGWYNEGVESAVLWANTHLEANATVAFIATPERSKRLLRSDLVLTNYKEATYLISNPEAQWFDDPTDQRLIGFTPIHEERAFNTPVASVLKRN